jgi:hypothetical protein
LTGGHVDGPGELEGLTRLEGDALHDAHRDS